MKNRKMIIAQDLDENLIDQITETAPDWTIITGKDPVAWQEHLKDAEIIAGWKKLMERDIVPEDTPLKWIQSWSAGVNSLPLKELENKNIQLTSASGVHAFPISETIFGLMLGLTRKIHTYVKNQSNKKWHHANMKQEIHHKTIGIIGVGVIGKETAKIAKAFGMTVLGVRNSRKSEEFVDEMYTSAQLNQVLPRCDFVIVTLPLTESTRHLFGKEQFAIMKKSALIINIGRGEIIVENELIDALTSGEIAGAGLDVFETEPLQQDSPLWDMDNVIITPHTAGSTEYYDQRVIKDIFLPNLKCYIDRKAPEINLVDYQRGY
jgi:phosphoglycerate dehydrogenase-like enzyme